MSDVRAELSALVPRLRRFGHALCGNPADADDLVQTACEKALRRLDQFTPGTRLDSWMFRIMQTSRIDALRSRQRRGTVADEDALAQASDEGHAARSPLARLELQRVRDEIAALPEEQRAVMALVALEGHSYAETAEILDVPVGTVMSRLSRARARLISSIEELA